MFVVLSRDSANIIFLMHVRKDEAFVIFCCVLMHWQLQVSQLWVQANENNRLDSHASNVRAVLAYRIAFEVDLCEYTVRNCTQECKTSAWTVDVPMLFLGCYHILVGACILLFWGIILHTVLISDSSHILLVVWISSCAQYKLDDTALNPLLKLLK